MPSPVDLRPVVLAIGCLIVLFTLAGLAMPRRFRAWLLEWNSQARFVLAVVARLATGAALALAAPATQTPLVSSALGYVTAGAGVAVLAVGRRRLDSIVAWWLNLPVILVALSYSVGATFGLFLLFTAS